MFTLPILYKKSSEGKIEQWGISVTCNMANEAITTVAYGEFGGKQIIKETPLSIGKNIGKRNETTPFDQAVLEAKAKHKKKLESGYVHNTIDAMDNVESELIEGGITPMLAHGYEDNKHKINYPVYVQPKLNGHRCIALKANGVVGLWSRQRHAIKTTPHLVQQVTELLSGFPDGTFLDGELYKHGWTLQKISGAGKKLKPESAELEYHIYDFGDLNRPQYLKERNSMLVTLEFNLPEHRRPHLNFVTTHYCNSEKSLMDLHSGYVSKNYEGVIIRDLMTVYEYKRSYSLLKLKLMQDAEFEIIDCNSGKGDTVIFTVAIRLDNLLGGCATYSDVTMSGSRKNNQKYLTDRSLWEGKMLTVQFQSYTPDGSLEFPIGLQIREDL